MNSLGVNCRIVTVLSVLAITPGCTGAQPKPAEEVVEVQSVCPPGQNCGGEGPGGRIEPVRPMSVEPEAGGECSKKPRPEQVERAKAEFREGVVRYNEGDYDGAIHLWRQAYDHDCTATALLLNMARAQEAAGDRLGAARSLRSYLTRTPNSPDADSIRRRIDNLEH